MSLPSRTNVDHVLMGQFDDSEWTGDELQLELARSAEANGWNELGMEEYNS